MTANTNRRRFLAGVTVSAASYNRILGANDRIAVAIIGCGDRGLLKEVLQFRNDTNVEVTAVCDTWRQMRERAAALVKDAGGAAPEPFVHYQDVLALKDVAAVVIGTPDHQHCTMLTAAARAGKDAYIEKPLAMHMKELNEAVDAVKKHGRITQMGTQGSSSPNTAAAREFIASGGLGKILKIEQSRNAFRPYWHRFAARPVAEADVDWKAFLMHRRQRPFDADQYAGWYGYRDFSLGPHVNLGVHFFNTVHCVTGAKHPIRASTFGGTFRWKDARTCPDSVETVFEYPEGFLVRYCTVFGTGANSYTRIIGTRGMIDASNPAGWTVTGERSGEADRVPEGTQLPKLATTHHMKNWLESIRTRKPAVAPIESGYSHSIATILADESFVRRTQMVYDPVRKTISAG